MAVKNQAEFITHIKRQLGEPVIKVNVADEQVEVVIDDAIEKFMEYHRDGNAKVYVAHKVTEDEAKAMQLDIPPHFTDITSIVSKDRIDNATFATHTWQMMASMFDPRGATSLSLSSYVLLQQRMDLIGVTLGTDQSRFDYEFVKYAKKLICLFPIKKDDIVVYEAYQNIDPRVSVKQGDPAVDVFPYEGAWNEAWLKDYAAAQLKMIWGQNLSKFGGIDLPGGVTLSGDRLIDEAREEIEKLEDELKTVHMDPVLPLIG